MTDRLKGIAVRYICSKTKERANGWAHEYEVGSTTKGDSVLIVHVKCPECKMIHHLSFPTKNRI